jgi:hypothetical protein
MLKTRTIIKQMEQADDFGYDDLGQILNSRLAPFNRTWCWNASMSNPAIMVITIEDADRIEEELSKIDGFHENMKTREKLLSEVDNYIDEYI